MLKRNIEQVITEHLRSGSRKILLLDGARQVGKTTVVRQVAQKLVPNYIELDLEADAAGKRLFSNICTVDDFYLRLSILAGDRMWGREDTLVFLDEIQAYPYLLGCLKPLAEDGRFTYIASSSLLDVALQDTAFIPMGSICRLRMYPLDFAEFLLNSGMSVHALQAFRARFLRREPLDAPAHSLLLDRFRQYLISGGMPEAVSEFLADRNILRTREIQRRILDRCQQQAFLYGAEHRRMTGRIYSLIPANMERKRKRLIIKDITGRPGRTFRNFREELDYLTGSGLALGVRAVQEPGFPLAPDDGKNLQKLYLNDPGLLSSLLYGVCSQAILEDTGSVGLGSVYETAVASELTAHGFRLFYYDDRNRGAVDFLVDDYETLSPLPIVVKSGKNYKVYHALQSLVGEQGKPAKRGIVLSNRREVVQKGNILHMPIYYIAFLESSQAGDISL